MNRPLILIPAVLLIAGLCWYGGYKEGERDANGPVRRAAYSRRLAAPAQPPPAPKPPTPQEQEVMERRRRAIIGVESARFQEAVIGLPPQLEYRLTNKSGRALREVAGSIRFYDANHTLIGGMQMNCSFPMAPGGVMRGHTTWLMSDAVRAALDAGKATTDYSADQVFYADGTYERFGPVGPNGAVVVDKR